ncbi:MULTISPECIES: 3-hydroxyacyl-CoA dehydrogenase/enoyl-CoA hydratase family protein [unclassified Bradyrhizobium]|uniref:3-hydroxyacyl-CoA dehydrogenase/enoyl-CoA hydratase family protein n=1 Tax=unclassified Bradyrhizobium TaxID=2631580 RepID=UPI00048BFA8E|nr:MULTISPECIES: 3-hydroxyacyl-CoA dehydrogenase/enoyl-CoA hydratase family protein [unclassified Bradyrhizobium]QIG98279.1 3-hydroxyacyl-CoA dehydrogenase/enoyl-CoA hydratase family protein [Bradyrhizobium sp. 6(2017)]
MTLQVRNVAVLGAGVMGAQIAAHLVNANIPVVLFDLAAKDGDPSGVAKKAIENLRKLSPPPAAVKDRLGYIEPANYDEHLAKLGECDLVIEAIAERMDWKLDLYKRIAPYVTSNVVIASNTSGLSIEEMGKGLPENLRSRFCGVHFFNPPRYMTLIEIIPVAATSPDLVDDLESFLTTTLGKGVVRALDTPNFIANRVGVFSLLAVMRHTQDLKLTFDAADAVTGPLIGRATSATFRTADVVGLDTMAHVVKTMNDRLPDDPWHKYYEVPAYVTALIQRGALGQKSGAGLYRREGRETKVLDPATQEYVPSGATVDPDVEVILKLKDPAEKFVRLRKSDHPQAQLVWRSFRDLFHYSAYHLGSIADNARDLDLGVRWGFGWREGPFEAWQSAGWKTTADAIKADIAADNTMARAPLPAWVIDGRVGVHMPTGSYSAREAVTKPRTMLPIYRRQRFPESVFGEVQQIGKTLSESDAARLWTTAEDGSDDVAILSLKSKAGTLGPDVVDAIVDAVGRAEAGYRGLVIWQPKPPFSAGANLNAFMEFAAKNDFGGLESFIARFQQMTARLKYSLVPVVAAINGAALGGGCEIAMHCARVVASLESQIGLVEAGVGLVPGGGGLKEFAVRAARLAQATTMNDPLMFLTGPFQMISGGRTATNALDAKEIGFLRESDVVAFNPNEVLHVAQQIARSLSEAGYRPPLPPKAVKVSGRSGIATLEQTLANMQGGGMISEHDYRVGRAIATGLCGGNVETGTLVDEDWLLAVERKMFVELGKTEKTQMRIKTMLETGRPLRN